MATRTAPSSNIDPTVRASPASAPQLDQEGLLALASEAQPDAIAGGETAIGPRARHFVRHLAEMFLAMMVGMMVLGGLDRGVLSALGTSVSHVRDSAPEAFALVMAFNMTVGMTLWMRYRRHSWAMCGEMAGAMFLPALAALVLFWCAVIHTKAVGGVEMGAMVPAMLAVMLFRLTEYSEPVQSRAWRRSAKAEAGTHAHSR